MTIENKTQSRVHIGKVLDAHGIKGDLYCIVFSGDASWISKLKTLNLNHKSFDVLKIKPFKKGFIVSLDGFADRNRAEEFKGSEIWVDSSLFTSKHGEAIFLSELLNFEVKDKTLGSVGRIDSFSSNGIQDLLVISSNNKTFEIPFVKEFVTNIDYSNNIIDMNLPEGLLEINEPDTHE